MSLNASDIAAAFEKEHHQIYSLLEKADGVGKFQVNPWNKDIGRGTTCVLEGGDAIEKAGVNYSNVGGKCSPGLKKMLGNNAEFYKATGISSIIHPRNPHAPIIHMNVRYFELNNGVSWFGGGIDLTPHYVDKSDARYFHNLLKNTCDDYHPEFYEKFKPWADEYFFIEHRNETRGIGGIFYDHINPEETIGTEQFLNFSVDLARLYPKVYTELLNRKRNKPFTPAEKQWQLLRRGRYVEFNLVYDRGTKFGLESKGNTESILVSLPPQAEWSYNIQPPKGTTEAQTQELLKKGIDWINIKE